METGWDKRGRDGWRQERARYQKPGTVSSLVSYVWCVPFFFFTYSWRDEMRWIKGGNKTKHNDLFTVMVIFMMYGDQGLNWPWKKGLRCYLLNKRDKTTKQRFPLFPACNWLPTCIKRLNTRLARKEVNEPVAVPGRGVQDVKRWNRERSDRVWVWTSSWGGEQDDHVGWVDWWVSKAEIEFNADVDFTSYMGRRKE